MKQFSLNTYILLFWLLTGILSISAFISYSKLKQYDESVKWVIHSNEAKNNFSEILYTLTDAETSQRGYLLTKDSAFFKRYEAAQLKTVNLMHGLDTLVAESLQRSNLSAFKKTISERLFLLKNNLLIFSAQPPDKIRDSLLLTGKDKMDKIRTFASEILAAEDKLLRQRLQIKNRSAAVTPVYLLAFTLLSLFALTLLFLRLRSETKLRFAIANDISERKKIEAIREESREKIHSFILQAPVAMCLYKGAGYVIEIVNNELLAIWGKPAEAVIGKPLVEVLPEAKNQGFEEIMYNVFTTGEKFTAYGTPITLIKNGTSQKTYVNLVYEAYRETDGTISGIVEVVVNVTQQVVAGIKVKESEERFAAAVAAVQGILWTNNAKGEMEGEQPGWAALTGQNYEEYQGYGWAQAIHPEDATPTLVAWNKAVGERKIFKFEHRLKVKGGEWGHFSVKAIPLVNADGSIREWVGVHTNITEQKSGEKALKESEEKFRGLAERLPHLVWITNEKGESVYASKSWQEYSGFNPYQDGNWAEIVHTEDMENMTNAWMKSLATGHLYHAETRLKNKFGEYRWHVVEGVPLTNDDGSISKWVGAFADIHDQKLKEQKKDEFISIASHEMKTPLTTAKGYLELLLLTLGSENPLLLLYAQKANNSIVRLQDLIAELLDASKIQNGKLNYSITSFDFNEMMAETVENIQQITASHSIKLYGATQHKINGDKNRLQQVVINLLSNAIKYSPNEKSVVVQVEEKKDVLQVSVKDFGVGMKKEHLEKIFDRYYRVQEHAVHFQGLGIGLYISYDIIKRHAGKMWVESEPGKGSIFYFAIPVI